LSNDEPDEERLSTADQSEQVKDLKSDLQDARAELVQMSDELRRFKGKESSLSAENQILKSKIMQFE
jgi:predicted  nucleic acid-binding Zn-ribbon protein